MMVAQPEHGGKLGLSVVSLTMQCSNEFTYMAFSDIKEIIENALIDVNFYAKTPFSWITLVVRYGLKNDLKPEYQKISKKYGDLPLAIEIDVNETVGASLDEMKEIIGRAVLVSVIDVGRKYDCPIGELEKMLENLPDSIFSS